MAGKTWILVYVDCTGTGFPPSLNALVVKINANGNKERDGAFGGWPDDYATFVVARMMEDW